MTALKDLSNYFDEDTGRKAVICQVLGTKHFVVTLTIDSGSSFSAASFSDLEEAEDYAEDWVLTK